MTCPTCVLAHRGLAHREVAADDSLLSGNGHSKDGRLNQLVFKDVKRGLRE